jgi:hypothetical protein
MPKVCMFGSMIRGWKWISSDTPLERTVRSRAERAIHKHQASASAAQKKGCLDVVNQEAAGTVDVLQQA